MRPAGTGPQITLFTTDRSLALLFRASDLIPSFWNNTNHFIQSLIIKLYRVPRIRRTICITTLYDNHTIGLLHSRTRDRLPTFQCHAGLATSPARVTHNDTRSLGNLDPPTVDHNNEIPIPTTVAHTNRYIHCPIFTLPPPPPPSTNVLKTRSDWTNP